MGKMDPVIRHSSTPKQQTAIVHAYW